MQRYDRDNHIIFIGIVNGTIYTSVHDSHLYRYKMFGAFSNISLVRSSKNKTDCKFSSQFLCSSKVPSMVVEVSRCQIDYFLLCHCHSHIK